MSRRRPACEVPMASSNPPESKFEVTEADVRILDRDDATQNMFSWEVLRMLCFQTYLTRTVLGADLYVSNRYVTILHAAHCAYGRETLQVYVKGHDRGLTGASPDESKC